MRRRGRESALQMLYQLDVGRQLTAGSRPGPWLDEAIGNFWSSFDNDEPVDREFAERLVRGVVTHVRELDQTLETTSANWKLERMEKVDRNLMRMAAYEILHCPDIPRRVSINEAVEIAKRFSGREAAAFVNGILDQLGDREEA